MNIPKRASATMPCGRPQRWVLLSESWMEAWGGAAQQGVSKVLPCICARLKGSGNYKHDCNSDARRGFSRRSPRPQGGVEIVIGRWRMRRCGTRGPRRADAAGARHGEEDEEDEEAEEGDGDGGEHYRRVDEDALAAEGADQLGDEAVKKTTLAFFLLEHREGN